jgi:hypothetical protein
VVRDLPPDPGPHERLLTVREVAYLEIREEALGAKELAIRLIAIGLALRDKPQRSTLLSR